ncbi:MAG: 50S ribosomal protein L18 [Candidatus Thermoplasmatota archaeon]|jgi:large subunit ribosomal protein L18|nr:50S ribosomal protein L18 [Candidatus Sysuiplasma jiujiangense]MBX8639995.1 50S ribosomal protein L18 [Candidatus Sysuiplasma jiujiangense]MBX8642022.1 50S ribosomal protein L18 [Candidatus Sysuiplasma jiujiangense]MCL4317273.1 50S ribosomal protein L18 [Candidatus Thermoplasmatota archaeon]MCL5253820.1 50S ribosomal protein L18 [Candidatus Thermoplasmatota archaeon]
MTGPRYKVPFRRRREGITDYSHRLRLLKSGSPRAVVRCSNRYFTVQFISFDPSGDRVIATANSIELRKYGWSGAASNGAAAFLTGMLAAARAKKHGVSEAILDVGMINPRKNGNMYAALSGMLEGGVEIPHDDSIVVPAARIEALSAGHGNISEIKTKLVK